ncbi:MAG TPA: sodium/solute symporter [Opitutaceae bacterium]|nr:sodium/solute symporter [Opitutaceae bacterium]
MPAPSTLLTLAPVDYGIIASYFVLILGLGWYLRRFVKTGESFFMAGHQMTAWIAGLSFISANLSTLETMGWSAMAAENGMVGAHAYLIGAIPAILFLAVVMMPFYYTSRIHSVPGYLKLRFGEGSRSLAGVSFAVMTVFVCGVGMFSMAKVLNLVLGWSMGPTIIFSSGCVAVYVMLGGLLSAVLTEVLQYFLIWLGLLLVPILGLWEIGGWHHLTAAIDRIQPGMTHLWATLDKPQHNAGGSDWFGIVFGDGVAISFGYWCTDFLQVQRVMAAKDLRAAENGTIIGAGLKMLVLFIVTVPGLLGLAVLTQHGIHLVGEGAPQLQQHLPGYHSYNDVLPLLMCRYLGPGLLGLGVTAMIAGFMSGMAGNISAFATVWTYDVYQPLIRRQASDSHYVAVGRWASIVGVLIAVATAYLCFYFDNILQELQILVLFFIVPLFGTVILGMLWKRTSPAAGFWGFLIGILAAVGQWVWIHLLPGAGGSGWHFDLGNVYPAHVADLTGYAGSGGFAQNCYMSGWALLATVAAVTLISLVTPPKPEAELRNLVMGLTPREKVTGPLWRRPIFWAGVVAAVLVAINLCFW